MKNILSDFVDPSYLFHEKVLDALKRIPHQLVDLGGKTLSEHSSGIELTQEVEIRFYDRIIAKLKYHGQNFEVLRELVETQILLSWEFRSIQLELERKNLLTKEIDQLLDLSEKDSVPLEVLLKSILRILRSHLWVENGSVFGIYDGFTLEGLAGIGGTDQQDWKMTFESAAGVAATSRKIFHSESPATDPKFSAQKNQNLPRNLLCLPLVHGSTLVGVMNLSNRIGGEFSPEDLQLAERFANLTAHVLQKDFLRKRMQSFEKTSDHLGKYLSSKVVKNVKNLNNLQLGGEEKYVVCLFSDIRGYTSISEEISAPVLVKLLNFYFEKMHAVIERHEGTLDKIVGDLIMAVWNIPTDQPDPEFLAVKTALEMQKEMIRVVGPEWASHGASNVGMGIGVNAGSAIVGNLGSSRFMNYTVVGDAVNTAQRLEAKAKGGEIWVSESIFQKVSGRIEKPLRKESGIRLKGKENLIDAYVYRPLSY